MMTQKKISHDITVYHIVVYLISPPAAHHSAYLKRMSHVMFIVLYPAAWLVCECVEPARNMQDLFGMQTR